MFALWTFLVVTHAHPPVKTPLLSCGGHCPQNVFFAGSSGSDCRFRRASGPVGELARARVRDPRAPVPRRRAGGSSRSAVRLRRSRSSRSRARFCGSASSARRSRNGCFELRSARPTSRPHLPSRSRFSWRAVRRAADGRPGARDVRARARRAPRDAARCAARPRAQGSIRSRSPTTSRASAGTSTPPWPFGPAPPPATSAGRSLGSTATAPRSPRSPMTPWLSDQAAFVEAAGAVALMRVEAARLQDDLTEVNQQLAASRLRLVEAADSERQRIERDLHDGVQQYVLGLRLRLDLAAETIRADPARGEQMLSAIGNAGRRSARGAARVRSGHLSVDPHRARD